MIEETIEKYRTLIHNPTLELTKELFEESAILISGVNPFYGPEEIYNLFLMQLLYKKYSTVTLVKEDLQIHPLDDNTVIVLFHYHTECLLRETNEPHGIQGIETQVLRKQEKTWKIAHIHYTSKKE